jgi:DNA-nicking Smr family endonuclease
VSKKQKKPDEDEEKLAAAPKVGTSMKGLLASVKLDAGGKSTAKKEPAPAKVPMKPIAKPPAPKPDASALTRPSDSLRGHDRTAYFDAMAGVRGLGARKDAPPPRATSMKLPPAPPSPIEREGDRAARERLAALVSGGLRFELRREDDWIAGLRHDAPRGTLENLSNAAPGREATLDLHGARETDVESRLAKFVRRAHETGVRRLRVVHGKGLHSDPAGPVLGDAVVTALTKGVAASRVLAFVTAPEDQGGSGALLVELTR